MNAFQLTGRVMPKFDRRAFLRHSTVVAALPLITGAAPGTPVCLVMDGSDPVASARPVMRAAHALQQALTKAGFTVQRAQTAAQANGSIIMAVGATFPVGAGALAGARVAQPTAPESLALFETKLAGKPAVVACGADARGLSYALYELADRVTTGVPLKFPQALIEKPANPVRSVMRQFTSELYDKAWFYDRAQWAQYFAMLAANRFNRIDLTFGLGYDMLKGVLDPYLVFTYPFLLAVPGYDVKVTNLPDAERARNLATLRYISDLAISYGLDFQLGLWMHGHEMKDTPAIKYAVTGITPENHGPYCRDALTALLKLLPAVSSVGLRIHGESGVAEGSYEFWKTVFAGVPAAGRKIEIDLHAKGIDDRMLADALATGMPINVSPKFATEHIGLPYHPADIRPSEIPPAGGEGKGLMTLSEGQRSFTRYGNADLLREDRKYTVRTRMFYGSQRILASGSAEAAAAYGRAFQFCGMTGFDLMEPLTYRGRRGSAVATSARDGYALRTLAAQYDWQKYDYWYRSFGRMTYNPDADVETVKRSFGKARATEAALASASRILPLVTSAHSESAACDLYWPEIYWNLPLASEADKFFWDTPSPRNFQNVTGLDPQLFTSCKECAAELIGEKSGHYSPLEAALWLDGFAGETEAALKTSGQPKSIDVARLAIDAEIQALLGRFFAAKLRAGVAMALFEQNHELETLKTCIGYYKNARGVWAKIVSRAHGVYADDLSISDRFTERGGWAARLPDIDADIAALEAILPTVTAGDAHGLAAIAATRARDPLAVTHIAPANFTRGAPVELVAAVREGLTKATLWYRHVTAAERWVAVDMTSAFDGWHAQIPAAYTDSPYPLQYYFEFRAAPERAWIWPGFDAKLLNQPYVVVRGV
jgi:hypothetical protein